MEQGHEVLLNLAIKRKEATVWSNAGHEEACTQFVLSERGRLNEIKGKGEK